MSLIRSAEHDYGYGSIFLAHLDWLNFRHNYCTSTEYV